MKPEEKTENKSETQTPNPKPSETTPPAEPKADAGKPPRTPTTKPPKASKTPKAAPKTKKSAKAKPQTKKPAKSHPKAKTASQTKPTPKANSKYRRHPQNPFREGSGYALAFDILASHKNGVVRADLTAEYAKAAKKPLKNASYDIAVLLSPKSDKPTSERHKSCRDGYGIRRENSHVEIVLP